MNDISDITGAAAAPTFDFASQELSTELLQTRRNYKWSRYEPHILPAFVAEMDFRVAPPIQQALERVVREQDYGYPKRTGFERAEHQMAQVFADRMRKRYGWEIRREEVVTLADLVQATFATLQAFTDEGDGVLLQVPAYPPFYEAIEERRRRLIPVRMHNDGSRYVMDVHELEKAAREARVLMLCNPHNPTGRALSREELLEVGRVAIENDLVIVSDEIHSDLVYTGHKHTPIGTLSPEIAARTVTINSPTKSFNIPGLRCAVAHFGSKELKDRFHKRIAANMLGRVNVLGLEACVAAWTKGDPWLSGLVRYLESSRDRLMKVLGDELPAIQGHRPEATYLAWLDCSRLDLKMPAGQFFRECARIGLSSGEEFDKSAPQFVRFNFATSNTILDEILDRMIKAVRKIS